MTALKGSLNLRLMCLMVKLMKRKGEGKERKPEKKDTVEWQLCDPMEVKDSPLRVNLYGKERTVEKKVTPPKPVTTWTIGMDY